tara:strand:- start:3730 stop:5904 length:2175 start_codon:yes stop_codon:yes gene_type:complete
MSFWSGLGRAMESNEAQRNVEAARDEREAARDKAEAWQNKTFEYGVNRDKLLDKRNEERTLAEQDRYDTSVALEQLRYDTNQTKEADAIKIDRTLQLLKLYPAGLVDGLSGDVVSPSKGVGVLSPEAITAGSSAFGAVFSELNPDQQKDEFWSAASKSPAAQATLIGFMEAQAKKGNTVSLSDMPKYFKYYGAVAGRGEDEIKEFMKNITSGDENVGDADTFIKGLKAAHNARGTKQLFIQTGAPSSTATQMQELDMWALKIESEAYRGAKAEGVSPEVIKETQLALAMLKNPEDKEEGLVRLATLGYGREFAMAGNNKENAVISSYYNMGADPASTTPVTTAPVITAPKGTVYNSWEEAKLAIEGGATGGFNVKGFQTPESGFWYPGDMNAKEPITNKPTSTTATELNNPKVRSALASGPAPESAFLGGGASEKPALPEDTPLDDMFSDVLEAGAEPATPGMSLSRDVRGPKALPNTALSEGSSRIKEAVVGLEGQEQLDSVVNEMEAMGIEWPTNVEELGAFKEDLKILVYEYKVDIPTDVLTSIVERAKSSVMSPTPDPEAIKEALAKIPEEVQQAITSVVAEGSPEDIEQAKQDIVKEFGSVAAGVLFDDAKSGRGTGKSAMMNGLQVPYGTESPELGYQPPTMMATELNTPAVREALSKIPEEVQQAVASVVTKGSPEDIEQAKQDVAQEYGEAVASILFDDAKSGRGTGKSAMLSGLK